MLKAHKQIEISNLLSPVVIIIYSNGSSVMSDILTKYCFMVHVSVHAIHWPFPNWQV